MMVSNRLLFQGSILRCHVSFREVFSVRTVSFRGLVPFHTIHTISFPFCEAHEDPGEEENHGTRFRQEGHNKGRREPRSEFYVQDAGNG